MRARSRSIVTIALLQRVDQIAKNPVEPADIQYLPGTQRRSHRLYVQLAPGSIHKINWSGEIARPRRCRCMRFGSVMMRLVMAGDSAARSNRGGPASAAGRRLALGAFAIVDSQIAQIGSISLGLSPIIWFASVTPLAW